MSAAATGLLDREIAFLDALRSAGLTVSLAEVLDATRAMGAIDLMDREALRAATTRDWDQYVDDEQRRLTRTPKDRLRAVVKPWLRSKHPRVFRALANTHYRYTSGVRSIGGAR